MDELGSQYGRGDKRLSAFEYTLSQAIEDKHAMNKGVVTWDCPQMRSTLPTGWY